MSKASKPLPEASGPREAAGRTGLPAPPQRLSVWDERARKMGFPPSSR